LQHAWKLLIQNHTHDAIGGCHVDSVSNDMLPRFEQVRHLGKVVVAAAIQAIASRVRPPGAPSFIVFNPLPAARREVIKTMVLVPPDFPVRHLHVTDARGQALPTHVRQVRKIRSRPEYPLPPSFLRICQPSSNIDERLAQLASDIEAYELTPGKKDKPWRVIELEALLENVPASGYRTFSLKSGEVPSRPAGVKIKGNTIENAFLRVRVYPDGTFDLHHKPTKRDFKRCNVLEDVEDAGDTYDYSPAARRALFTSKNRRGRLRFIQKSPLAAIVECSLIMALPEALDRRAGKRRRRLTACSTRVLLTVNAADPWVHVVVEFDNQARDHRLSASFAAPLSTTISFAGQSFYVVERTLKISAGKNWKQPPADTAPLQDFCMVEDRRGGLALLARGLYEYRAQREGRNTALKLTLLRAVGWLSRDELSTRPGHAGPHVATPGAQCPGAQRFEYAIMPYAANWRAANVQGHALRFQSPVLEAPCMNGGGNLPDEFSLVSIEPSTLRFSALKKCAYRDTVILRVTNLHAQRGKAKIRCGKPLRHAWKVTLAENRIEEIPILHDDTVEVDMPGWRILTLELEPGKTTHGV
jgi:alpha-mannosidase